MTSLSSGTVLQQATIVDLQLFVNTVIAYANLNGTKKTHGTPQTWNHAVCDCVISLGLALKVAKRGNVLYDKTISSILKHNIIYCYRITDEIFSIIAECFSWTCDSREAHMINCATVSKTWFSREVL